MKSTIARSCSTVTSSPVTRSQGSRDTVMIDIDRIPHDPYAPRPIKVEYFEAPFIHTDQKIRVANITMNHLSIMKSTNAFEGFVTMTLTLLFRECEPDVVVRPVYI